VIRELETGDALTTVRREKRGQRGVKPNVDLHGPRLG
jgi:hypothetical protein